MRTKFIKLVILLIIISLWIIDYIKAQPLPVTIEAGEIVFRYQDAFADKVTIAGNFNNWNPDQYKLRKEKDDIFVIKLKLDVGMYEYKYIIDGNWMSGDNIKLKVIRNERGELEVKEKTAQYNILSNTKVYVNGGYFFKGGTKFEDKSNNNRYSWRITKPDNEMDLNIELSINQNVSVFANLNANYTERGDAQFRMDEASMRGELGPVSITGFLNQRLVDIDDPLRIIDYSYRLYTEDDAWTEHWHYIRAEDPFRYYGSISNLATREMFLIGEQRTEDCLYGKGLQGGILQFEPWGFNNTFFFLDSIRSDRVFFGYRGKKSWDMFYIGGLFYTDRIEDGLWGNLDFGGDRYVTVAENGMNYSNAGGADRWWRLDSPNLWVHNFDNVIILDADGRNQNRLAGIDAGLLFDYVKLYFEYINEHRESAYVASLDGVNDAFNNATEYSRYFYGRNDGTYTRAFGAQEFGGDHRGNIFLVGCRFDIIKSFDADLFVYFHDRESVLLPLYGDTDTLLRVSPQRDTITGRLRYKGKRFNAGLELSYTRIDDYPVVTFENIYDEYGFYGLEILGAKKRNTATLLMNWKPIDRIDIFFGDRYKNFRYYDKKADVNFTDFVFKFKWTKRLYNDAGIRLVNYDVNTVDHTYTFPHLGIGYQFLKNVNLRLYYGIDYLFDDDKLEGGRYDLWSKYGYGAERAVYSYNPNIDPNVNDLFHAEDLLKKEKRVVLEAKVIFE
ncbi:MAG: hypothetical protein AB1765_11165 [Candidatus Hydrogenedentota bacterium]